MTDADTREHFDTLISHLQQQLDRRIETQLREVEQVREALVNKIDAVDERVLTIFSEQRHAQVTAEQEREKAAEQLRLSMERLIQEGDANLTRHVDAQFKSVEAALAAVEKLGDEKDKRIESMRAATEMAVDKALTAQKELSEKHNDLIRSGERKEATYASKEELAQVRSVLAEQGGYFVRRDVVEAELKALNKRLDLHEGGKTAIDRRQSQGQQWQIWVAGAILTIVLALVVILTNVAT